MALDSLLGVLGEFWLPTNTANKVTGILNIEPESDTRELTLTGHLFESIPWSSTSNNSTIIHGYIDHTLVTLIGCLCRLAPPSISAQKCRVSSILSGVHISDASKRIIKEVHLQYDNINSWIPAKPIKHSRESMGIDHWKLDVSVTSEPLIELSNTYFGSVETYRSISYHPEQHKLDIMSESKIILNYRNGASIEEAIEHCSIIRNLAAMMTSTMPKVTLLKLVVSIPSTDDINWYPDWREDRVARKSSEYEVITYTELGGIDAVAKCFNNYNKSHHDAAVLRRLGSFWFSGAPYNGWKFMSMTVALEHLYKSISTSNCKLEDQLKYIVDPIAEDISRFIPDIEWLGKKSVRCRAWAAHATTDIPPDELLFKLMCSLYLCIVLRYMHCLGANIKEVCDKIYYWHRLFGSWDSVFREAMEEHP